MSMRKLIIVLPWCKVDILHLFKPEKRVWSGFLMIKGFESWKLEAQNYVREWAVKCEIYIATSAITRMTL